MFGLIAEHRRLYDAMNAATSDATMNLAWDRLHACEGRLAVLKPTTAAGLAAIIDYRAELEEKDFILFPTGEDIGPRMLLWPPADLTTWLGTIKQAVIALA